MPAARGPGAEDTAPPTVKESSQDAKSSAGGAPDGALAAATAAAVGNEPSDPVQQELWEAARLELLALEEQQEADESVPSA